MIFIKTVGIVIREFSENNKEFIGSRLDLFQYVSRFNVNVIGIPINSDFKKLKNVIMFCDGIILSGGEKFHSNDFKLVEYLYKNDIPTLGICLGMQSIAEYFNGRKEIYVDNHYSTKQYVHNIKIDEDSLLFKIMGEGEISVNSRHYSAIPFTSMKVSARSLDGVIEAVELSNNKFFLGVEWHPESIGDESSYKLFKYFIDSI